MNVDKSAIVTYRIAAHRCIRRIPCFFLFGAAAAVIASSCAEGTDNTVGKNNLDSASTDSDDFADSDNLESTDSIVDTESEAANPTLAQLQKTCTDLKDAKIDDATVTSTKWFGASADNPAFCKVNATRAPYLDMEVDVPENWSGRLWQQGGGGLDGTIPSAVSTDTATGEIVAVNLALKTGLSVYAASNGGNRKTIAGETTEEQSREAAPLVWVDGTSDGVVSAVDYAHEALDTTRELALEVTRKFYGRLPKYRYFNGCSNGGRNAYVMAGTRPESYDGIVAGCMGMDAVGQTAAWLYFGALVGTSRMPSQEQWSAVTQAAVTACDALDGVSDEMIANPSECDFDVSALACGGPSADTDASLCLTDEQVQTVKDLISDIKLADDTTIYSGFAWADWASHIPYFGVLGGANAILVTGDPTWLATEKQQSFDLARDYPLLRYGLRLVGANPDIDKVAAFVASGKKLISWHDGADNLLSTNDHIRNYAAMTKSAKAQGLKDPSTNTRFFIVPGGSHSQGQALTEVDWFSAMTDWVEQDVAPEELVYTKTDTATKDVRTLPVCRHPQYPRYNGSGEVNVAESYTCTTPR